jgi:hypothetical protein
MSSRLILAACGLALSLNLSAAQTCNNNMLASIPDDRFTVNGDGTVTDIETGLVWRQCLEGQSGADCSSGTANSFTWQEALQHAAAQGDDWRLPNIKELASIVELRCYDPAINLNIFPNTPSSAVWSGSPDANYSHTAWGVHFLYGNDYGNNRSYSGHVRLVRGGQ